MFLFKFWRASIFKKLSDIVFVIFNTTRVLTCIWPSLRRSNSFSHMFLVVVGRLNKVTVHSPELVCLSVGNTQFDLVSKVPC